MITFTLLIIGGLNWGLEAFGTGLGHWVKSWPVVMLVYLLVGISALVEVFTHKKNCCCCNGTCAPKGPMPM